jgi:hypothetical protein
MVWKDVGRNFVQKGWALCLGCCHLASCSVVVEGLCEIIAQIAGQACRARSQNNGEGVALVAAEGHQRSVLLHIQACGIVSNSHEMLQQNDAESRFEAGAHALPLRIGQCNDC